jgi:hypothetical protein
MPPLTDVTITRFPGGITNVGESNILNAFRDNDPTKYHMYYNEFDTYAAGDWTITLTGTGTTALSAAQAGGALLLTTTAGATDANFLQKVGAGFIPVAGKKGFFKVKFQMVDATLQAFYAGLMNVDTTPLTAAHPTDGIYFVKAAGAATIDFFVRKDATTGSNTAAAIASVVAATDMTLGWYYDGVDRVYYSVNEVVLGSISGAAAFLPDAALAISFGTQNGVAVAKTALIDYIFCAQER